MHKFRSSFPKCALWRLIVDIKLHKGEITTLDSVLVYFWGGNLQGGK